jgi:hypothetical protein
MQYRMHIYNPKIQNNDLTNYVQQKHFQMWHGLFWPIFRFICLNM